MKRGRQKTATPNRATTNPRAEMAIARTVRPVIAPMKAARSVAKTA